MEDISREAQMAQADVVFLASHTQYQPLLFPKEVVIFAIPTFGKVMALPNEATLYQGTDFLTNFPHTPTVIKPGTANICVRAVPIDFTTSDFLRLLSLRLLTYPVKQMIQERSATGILLTDLFEARSDNDHHFM